MKKSICRFFLAPRALTFAAIVLLPLQAATAASFPCERATSAIEKTICRDTELSTLDEYLGRYYAAARDALGAAATCLADNQKSWLRTRRDVCKDSSCLKGAYLQRLAELDGLQPGATSIRNVDLPNEMPLMWVIAPALDEIAAPRNVRTIPLAVRGKLVDEVASGDGFVVRTTTGKKHLVVSLMFLEPRTADALASLARTPNAGYEVRGQTEVGAAGNEPFAPGRCTFVYRTTR